jgi:hypothetical protein
MAFLFGANRRQRQPIDIARSIKDLLRRLWNEPKNPRVRSHSLYRTNCAIDEVLAGGRRARQANGTDETYCPGHSRFVPVPTMLQNGSNRTCRSRMQPRTSSTTRAVYYSRRSPFRLGKEYKNAAFRSTKGCTDHIFPHPSMEADERAIKRVGHLILGFQKARDYCGTLSRLRIPGERTSLWDYITPGNHAG